MKTRACLCATLIGIAASVPFSVASPFADTAVGVGTVLGNSLNGTDPAGRPLDKEWPVAKHTPTGQMFRIPFVAPDVRKAASGWEFSGHVEFGYLGGDADEESARFRMYQDIDEGAYLNNFNLQLRKPEGGYTLEIAGGAAGRHDQYYGVQFGRTNHWKVRLFFSEIPHIFTDRYKSLWNGAGSGSLTLLPGLTPGGSSSTANDNASIPAIASENPTVLGLTRKRGGVRVDLNLGKTWTAYAGYALEKREGGRPLGSVWGNSGGTAPLEIVEPIDYDTEDIFAGIQHVAGLNALNVRFTASLFHNNIDTLTFEEPYRIAPAQGVITVPAAGAFTHGRFDLNPSNDAYNIRAEYTRSMPEFYRGYVTAVVSAGTWRQDDELIPYMVTPNVTQANVMILQNGSWDSVTALSRRSADMVIDTRHAHLAVSLNPTDMLNIKARGRYYENDNSSDPFLSVNPNAVYTDADPGTAGNQTRGLTLDGVTGVWGRPLNDGSGQSLVFGTNTTPAGNVLLRSEPYSLKQYRFGVTADQRVRRVWTFNAALDREITQRTNRDRDRTWEDKIKVGLVNRALGDATVRASYEYARRRGNDYRPSVYDDAFSPVLVGIPSTAGTTVNSWIRGNSGMRTFDLADRDQHVVNARIDKSVRANLDTGLTFQLRDSEYPNSPYGTKTHDQLSANLDLNYQPSPRQTIYGFYSYQFGRARQRSIAQGGGNVVIGQDSPLGPITPSNAVAIGSAPGGPVYPLLNEWRVTSVDRNYVVGVGLHQELGKAILNIDYSHSTGRTRIRYRYNVGGAINAANAPFAGNRMPDLALDMDYVDASLRFPLTERLAARLLYRFQKESIRDWHYRNLHETPVVLGGQGAGALPTAVVLDGGPDDYKVDWFGVMFQLKL